ncbi:protein of unknown function [Marinobacter sp. LV10R510-11A]|uniref:AAA family ATPase n=1 Tax=Marinobacter sp. LV10R510-11A TaxID=1415568 RepID=UPI000BB79816|nr:AAA family ATPase [Marinobacter sp. LV10R510-11A]SOB75610.1 protein of unknown function [Marinobacter sp. LV10R510-11A]
MQSENFQSLKGRWPELYEHASFAEAYVLSEPTIATIKLRCFAETLVGILYRELNLPSEPGEGFFEKLKAEHFEGIVENPIRQKLHVIRCLGNKAAHGRDISTEQAGQLLKESYLLGHWLYKTYSGEVYEDYPEFSVPEPQAVSEDKVGEASEDLARQLEQAKQDLAEVQAAEQLAQQENSVLNASLDEVRLETFRNASARASSTMDLDEKSTRRLLNIEDAFAEYSLNDGQTELVKRLGEFLSSKTDSVFLLRGYAGTGKTFITKGLTEYFRSIGRNYVLAAPTGKASKVIAAKTRSPAYTLHKTIYSFKDIAEYRDGDLDGTETYKFYAQLAVNEMSADTVFIVDEASMVADVYNEAEFFRFGSGFLLQDFLKFVNLDHNDHRKKVIFIGDDAQLPPVGMSFPPALAADYLFREHGVRSTGYELTEVVRQKADSGVMKNSIALRKALHSGTFNQLAVELDYPDVDKVEHGDLMSRYLESCGGKINGESIVIAHSNADVAGYNQGIREHFFPGRSEVTEGDKVMAISNSSAHGFFISNGDFGLIKQVLGESERRPVRLKRKNSDTGEVESIDIALAFRDVRIGFKNLEGNNRFFHAKILEDLLYSDKPSLSSDENKALYLDFCIRNGHLKRGSLEFKNTLMSDLYFNAMRLKFGYAITCHKAQGSEWNHVFVKCKTHQSQLSADYFRWFYTAITRTSQNLYLLDPPNLKLGGGIKVVQPPGVGLPQGMTSPDGSPREEGSAEKTIDAAKKAVTDESCEGPPKSEPTQGQNANTLGIPATAPFLLALLGRVQDLIAGTDISIEGVGHNQYQEAYTFRRGEDFARVDIGYNGKAKISRVTSQHLSEFSSQVIGLLAPLKGAPVASAPTAPADRFNFEEDFLSQFHHRLIPLAEERGIVIQNVVKHPWSLRYTFNRQSEVAVYDIFFDGGNRFTKCQALITACSPGSLVGEVQLMLTEGLSA